MELDLWLPSFNLAIEYQGEQHYHELGTAFGHSGGLIGYSLRDRKKKEECTLRGMCESDVNYFYNLGICLVVVPYWWDGTTESLKEIIYFFDPSLFQKLKHSNR